MLRMIIHYDNRLNFLKPVLHLWYHDSRGRDIPPSRFDTFGPVFDVHLNKTSFGFKFKDISNGVWEDFGLDRYYNGSGRGNGPGLLDEIWCKADKPFIYPMRPKADESIPVKDFLQARPLKTNGYIPASDDVVNLVYCAGCRGDCSKCANSRVEENQRENRNAFRSLSPERRKRHRQ